VQTRESNRLNNFQKNFTGDGVASATFKNPFVVIYIRPRGRVKLDVEQWKWKWREIRASVFCAVPSCELAHRMCII
jgi:hypothetical protein